MDGVQVLLHTVYITFTTTRWFFITSS